jgi:hypothetical protein
MSLNLSSNNKKTIMTMLDNGDTNGRISLKFPGILKKQIDIIRAELNKGTEQTKRKLKRDPLLTIYRNGDIDLNDLYAAEYIRYAFNLITADVTLRVMSFSDFIDVLGSRGTERESELQARIQNQYTQWFDRCTKSQIKVGPIIHLLTEAVSLREVDKYFGYRNGNTKKFLVKGLKLYVKMFKPRKALDF